MVINKNEMDSNPTFLPVRNLIKFIDLFDNIEGSHYREILCKDSMTEVSIAIL